jgi:1-acyl-sn-glycerol-3-phosphate acyltransferase
MAVNGAPHAPGDGRRIPPAVVLRFLARLCRLLMAPFVRLEIRGGACAPRLKTAVIVANHRSMGDAIVGLVILHHFDHYPRVLVAREWVEESWTRVFARAIGAIPVDRRGDPAHALDAAIDTLRAGVPILVMPEGRFHEDDDPNTTGPAKTGAARLAAASDVPIVVAALAGTADVWPPGHQLPRLNPFRRRVIVCQAADEEMMVSGDDPRADTEAIMTELRTHLRQSNKERDMLL